MPFFWNVCSKPSAGSYTDEVEGVPLTVNLKPIRNMYLRVVSVDGPVRVSAPTGTSPDVIRRFVLARMEWIRAQRERLGSKPLPPPGFIMYLGNLVEETSLCGDIPPQGRTAVLQARFRRELHNLLAANLEIWQPRLQLYADSWHVRRMVSRWGSCNPRTKRLCFNAELIRHSPDCIEYVVVHELVHLAVHGHNVHFWAAVADALPDWKRRRGLLRGRG